MTTSRKCGVLLLRVTQLCTAGLVMSACPAVFGQTAAPPKAHAERLTFDPLTDQWTVAARPVPGTEDGDLNIARQWMAREDYKEALKAANAWIKSYGKSAARYPEALYIKATALLQLGDYRGAHDSYQELLNNYPGSELAERALSAEFRIAEQYLAGKKRKAFKGLFRVKDREAGIKIMDDMVANYADTPLAELAQKAKADYYYGRGDFELAEEEYAAFARDHPRSRYHAYALLQSARSALASFPGVQFDDAALVEAQERFTQFMHQYPDIARQQGVPVILDQIAARRADKTYEIAYFYDRTGKKQAARYYYRATVKRWPNTPAAEQAQGRLAALGEQGTALGPLGIPEAAPKPPSEGGG